MRPQLIKLREKMKEQGIDACIIPSTDFHDSEYVNEYFKCREYISGFNGSEGTLVVTEKEALLWTDGRYFLQAEAQLAGSGIDLMKMGEEGVPTVREYLLNTLTPEQTLAFDGRLMNCNFVMGLEGHCRIVYDVDLAGEVWEDRPALFSKPIYPLPEKVTGESHESKMARLRSAMKEQGADYHLITRLEEIAWLYNLRGDDIEYTPVFFAFALIEADRARLYLLNEDFSFGASPSAASAPDTELLPYFQIFDDLKALNGGSLLLDEKVVSYAMIRSLPASVKIIDGPNPCEMMKAVKNPTEIACAKAANLRDGVAVTKFIYWLKQEMAADAGSADEASGGTAAPLTEISAADHLEELRREQGCFELSFETIAGYGSNGAIIHYAATEETNKELRPEGFLLVDSGGQYEDGTTDITRTIALGPLTDEMKRNYTTVLKSNIRLSSAKFWHAVNGQMLDEFTREPIQEIGYDYNHGTGHGIGHILSVHEGPNTISRHGGESPICPGMITSDEPGIYIEGEYGIRLENEILCVEMNKDDPLCVEASEDMRAFEIITFCPFERQAILPELLETEELEWVNAYQKLVCEKLSPYLNEDERTWLEKETAPL